MIRVAGLEHHFRDEAGGDVLALQNVDLDVAEGEFLAIVGPSGCGKTTLLNILAGLEKSQTGALDIEGRQPRSGDPAVGYMLARDCLLPWRRAVDNAALGLEMQGQPKHERRARALAALQSMGLASFEASYPAQLSQGMRQRVALARVFATAPRLLLLDEPFSALDAQTKLSIQDAFLRAWQQRAMTVVLITHDLGEAVALADRVVVMTRRPGRIKAIHRVDLKRPRSAIQLQGNSDYHRICEAVWQDLRDEFVDVAPEPTPAGVA